MLPQTEKNYTTPEQSERLLNIGIPSSTADCFYSKGNGNWHRPRFITEDNIGISFLQLGQEGEAVYYPCWSTAQLENLWDKIGNGSQNVTAKKGTSKIELLVKLFESNASELNLKKLKKKQYKFKPFDKVLVRFEECEVWLPAFYSFHNQDDMTGEHYCMDGKAYQHCIPYKGNEHLAGTTNNPE